MKNSIKTALSTLAISAAAFSNVQANGSDASMSGWLSLDLNSHFMSYGADVWNAGSGGDALFEPSAGLDMDWGNGLVTYIGIWFDINDQAVSTIGGRFQEIDVWAGFNYQLTEEFNVDVAFQQWYYAGETEGIVDLTLAADWMFAPYVKAHIRTEPVGTQEEGVMFEIGAGHDFTGEVFGMSEDVSFSIPAAIGFTPDKYHAGDDGFAYANIGLNASTPLEIFPEGFYDWDLHGGVTFWHTDGSVIPANRDDAFLTWNIGIGTSW